MLGHVHSCKGNYGVFLMAGRPDQAWKGARAEAYKNHVGPDGAWMVLVQNDTGIYKAAIFPISSWNLVLLRNVYICALYKKNIPSIPLNGAVPEKSDFFAKWENQVEAGYMFACIN